MTFPIWYLPLHHKIPERTRRSADEFGCFIRIKKFLRWILLAVLHNFTFCTSFISFFSIKEFFRLTLLYVFHTYSSFPAFSCFSFIRFSSTNSCIILMNSPIPR